MNAQQIREAWMRAMGLDDAEIAAACAECPATDVAEETTHWEAMQEVARLNEIRSLPKDEP